MNFKKNIKEEVIREIKKLSWKIDSSEITDLLDFSIGIKTIESPEEIEIGRSKLGGLPDLPEDVEWPSLNGRPFAFIGQINLTDIKFSVKDNLLQQRGILYFFFSTSQSDYQLQSLEDLHKTIFYKGDLSDLKTIDYPLNYDEKAKFRASKVDFFEFYSLPSYNNYKIKNLNLCDEDEDLLFGANEIVHLAYNIENEVSHQMLGNYNPVQNDINYWWAFQFLRLKNHDSNESTKDKIQEKEKDFVLLLQIDLLDRIPLFDNFGTDGAIYYGISKDDLKNELFSKTKFVLQNA